MDDAKRNFKLCINHVSLKCSAHIVNTNQESGNPSLPPRGPLSQIRIPNPLLSSSTKGLWRVVNATSNLSCSTCIFNGAVGLFTLKVIAKGESV